MHVRLAKFSARPGAQGAGESVSRLIASPSGGLGMGINWFEGGRRIASLLATLIMIGGALYLFAGGGSDAVVLETTSPDVAASLDA